MIGACYSHNAHIVFFCLGEVAFANFLLIYLDSWQFFFVLNNIGKSSEAVTDKQWHALFTQQKTLESLGGCQMVT